MSCTTVSLHIHVSIDMHVIFLPVFSEYHETLQKIGSSVNPSRICIVVLKVMSYQPNALDKTSYIGP